MKLYSIINVYSRQFKKINLTINIDDYIIASDKFINKLLIFLEQHSNILKNKITNQGYHADVYKLELADITIKTFPIKSISSSINEKDIRYNKRIDEALIPGETSYKVILASLKEDDLNNFIKLITNQSNKISNINPSTELKILLSLYCCEVSRNITSVVTLPIYYQNILDKKSSRTSHRVETGIMNFRTKKGLLENISKIFLQNDLLNDIITPPIFGEKIVDVIRSIYNCSLSPTKFGTKDNNSIRKAFNDNSCFTSLQNIINQEENYDSAYGTQTIFSMRTYLLFQEILIVNWFNQEIKFSETPKINIDDLTGFLNLDNLEKFCSIKYCYKEVLNNVGKDSIQNAINKFINKFIQQASAIKKSNTNISAEKVDKIISQIKNLKIIVSNESCNLITICQEITQKISQVFINIFSDEIRNQVNNLISNYEGTNISYKQAESLIMLMNKFFNQDINLENVLDLIYPPKNYDFDIINNNIEQVSLIGNAENQNNDGSMQLELKMPMN